MTHSLDVAQKRISRVGVEPTTGVKIKLYPHKHTTLTTELTGINSSLFMTNIYQVRVVSAADVDRLVMVASRVE